MFNIAGNSVIHYEPSPPALLELQELHVYMYVNPAVKNDPKSGLCDTPQRAEKVVRNEKVEIQVGIVNTCSFEAKRKPKR